MTSIRAATAGWLLVLAATACTPSYQITVAPQAARDVACLNIAMIQRVVAEPIFELVPLPTETAARLRAVLEMDIQLLEAAGEPALEEGFREYLSLLDGPPGPVTIDVFFDEEATAGEKDRVEEILRAGDGVTSVRFRSHADAYREFQELFEDSPELVREVDPSSLPESFTARVDDTDVAQALSERLSRQAGVLDVKTDGGRSTPQPPEELVRKCSDPEFFGDL